VGRWLGRFDPETQDFKFNFGDAIFDAYNTQETEAKEDEEQGLEWQEVNVVIQTFKVHALEALKAGPMPKDKFYDLVASKIPMITAYDNVPEVKAKGMEIVDRIKEGQQQIAKQVVEAALRVRDIRETKKNFELTPPPPPKAKLTKEERAKEKAEKAAQKAYREAQEKKYFYLSKIGLWQIRAFLDNCISNLPKNPLKEQDIDPQYLADVREYIAAIKTDIELIQDEYKSLYPILEEPKVKDDDEPIPAELQDRMVATETG
jgi:hypothetical protein